MLVKIPRLLSPFLPPSSFFLQGSGLKLPTSLLSFLLLSFELWLRLIFSLPSFRRVIWRYWTSHITFEASLCSRLLSSCSILRLLLFCKASNTLLNLSSEVRCRGSYRSLARTWLFSSTGCWITPHHPHCWLSFHNLEPVTVCFLLCIIQTIFFNCCIGALLISECFP